MKVDQFKNLIKESIKEVLVEEGLLTEVITTVIQETRQAQAQQPNVDPAQLAEAMKTVQNMQANLNKRTPEEDQHFIDQARDNEERAQKQMQKMHNLRNKMMESIGKSSYKDLYNLEGFDLFEGTTPLGKGGVPGESPSGQGPLSGVDPNDAGVAIDSLLENKNLWQQLMKKK